MRKCITFSAMLVLMAAMLLCGCETTEQIAEGVVIALLDTGVSTTAITNEHLLTGYNYVEDSTDTEDKINHGTAIASVILGCESAEIAANAPKAYVIPLVVMTKQDGEIISLRTEQLAQVIRDSVDIYHADIINMSLGIQKDDPAIREAVEYATEQGVLVISAVGNSGKNGNTYYPAAYANVLAVGSCDKYGEESDFSQPGADVLAQGEDIWLASRNGVTYGARGTSYATGFVSAEAANILLEDEGLQPQELMERIISYFSKQRQSLVK